MDMPSDEYGKLVNCVAEELQLSDSALVPYVYGAATDIVPIRPILSQAKARVDDVEKRLTRAPRALRNFHGPLTKAVRAMILGHTVV